MVFTASLSCFSPMPRNTRNIKEEVWDSSGSATLFPASRSKVRQMLSTGECILFCKNCGLAGSTEAKKSLLSAGKRCKGVKGQHDLSYKVTPVFRQTSASSASIPAREMQANAGLGRSGAVKAAQAKVKFFPMVNAIEMFIAPAGRSAALAQCSI